MNFSVPTYQEQVHIIIKLYRNARASLIKIGYSEIYSLLPDIYYPITQKSIGTIKIKEKKDIDIDEALGFLYQVLVGCYAGYGAIDEILSRHNIPRTLANELKDLRERITKMEISSPDIEKNFNEAIMEIEHGHYLASGLISARIIDYIMKKFEGKNY